MTTSDEDWHEFYYILIAEGGGWPTHAIGPFLDEDEAEAYQAADKWRESWGGLSTEVRDLKVIAPEGDGITFVYRYRSQE